jgi:hypothetical protein
MKHRAEARDRTKRRGCAWGRAWTLAALGLLIGAVGSAEAKVDLVTLPERDRVQLTIYNSADLTLVRESRHLTLRKGLNRLQFGWANTLIDPTSVSLRAIEHPDAVQLLDVSYPPRTRGVAVWNVLSEIAGEEPVEINFFTAGLSWNAYYLGTLTPDEQALELKGYVRVRNQSGEDYERAQTRLLVGKVHLIDEILELARREYPYGTPIQIVRDQAAPAAARARLEEAEGLMRKAVAVGAQRPKEIIKEGLAEYFLFSIEGEETIPDGWAKRLPSFRQDAIPVVNLYRFDESRWNNSVIRFLSFVNDEAHGMGQEPLPGGTVKVFRQLDVGGHLGFVGSSNLKYVPKGEEIELSLGAAEDVKVEATLMRFRTDRYLFNARGEIEGWDEVRTVRVQTKNHRPLPVRVEVWRHFPVASWDLENSGTFGRYEKVDLDTVKYTLELLPGAEQTFTYQLTTHHGKRAE